MLQAIADHPVASFGRIAKATGLPRIGGRDLAISIAMPTARMGRQREAVTEALVDLRRRVVAEYGKNIRRQPQRLRTRYPTGKTEKSYR